MCHELIHVCVTALYHMYLLCTVGILMHMSYELAHICATNLHTNV